MHGMSFFLIFNLTKFFYSWTFEQQIKKLCSLATSNFQMGCQTFPAQRKQRRWVLPWYISIPYEGWYTWTKKDWKTHQEFWITNNRSFSVLIYCWFFVPFQHIHLALARNFLHVYPVQAIHLIGCPIGMEHMVEIFSFWMLVVVFSYIFWWLIWAWASFT
jgi:hypothetical protein